jgi:transposase
MLPLGLEIFICTEPVDLRLGFERLGGLVRERIGREPRSRAMFVFFGKRRHTVKVLSWDGTGMVLWHKRLDMGQFQVPVLIEPGAKSVRLSAAEFEAFFAGLSTRVVH